jgi:hypothetical protein
MATALLVALAISAFVSLFLCWRYTANTFEVRRMRGEVDSMRDRRERTQALLNETGQYAMHNPKMEAILDSLGFKLNKTNAPAATKPSK